MKKIVTLTFAILMGTTIAAHATTYDKSALPRGREPIVLEVNTVRTGVMMPGNYTPQQSGTTASYVSGYVQPQSGQVVQRVQKGDTKPELSKDRRKKPQ